MDVFRVLTSVSQGGLSPVGVFRVLSSVTRFVQRVMEEREWIWLASDMVNTGVLHLQKKNQEQITPKSRCTGVTQSGDRTHPLSPSFAH